MTDSFCWGMLDPHCIPAHVLVLPEIKQGIKGNWDSFIPSTARHLFILPQPGVPEAGMGNRGKLPT